MATQDNLLGTTTDHNFYHTDSLIGNAELNFFYVITVLDGSDNESEESNRVGEVDHDLHTNQ